MTSIGCRAGHPLRGPSLEESIELGSWAPLEELERRANRQPSYELWRTTMPKQALAGTPGRWEGRAPMPTPLSVSAQPQAQLLFGRTHATRPEQPSPRAPSQAARGHSMRFGRSWTPIMQRYHHLDSWEPAAKTSTAYVSKLADVSAKDHKKPVGDNNTRRLNAHAALLRMLAKESVAACEPPPDPRVAVRQRLERQEIRAEAERWALCPPDQATCAQQHAAAVNRSAVVMSSRQLASSWAANETHRSSTTGWSQGFAASARGRTNIYAHRSATRSLTDRSSNDRRAELGTAQTPNEQSCSSMPHPPDRARRLDPAACAEAEVLRQLLGGFVV